MFLIICMFYPLIQAIFVNKDLFLLIQRSSAFNVYCHLTFNEGDGMGYYDNVGVELDREKRHGQYWNS